MRKEDLYDKVMKTLFRLEVEKGHMKWTMTDLARHSQVPRTLLYYHFGSSKEKLLNDAVGMIAEEIFGLSKAEFTDRFPNSVLKAKKLSDECPWISQFYLKWRSTSSEIGDRLRQIEKEYDRRIHATFPHFSKHNREALFAVFFGLFSFPGLSDQALTTALTLLEGLGVHPGA